MSEQPELITVFRSADHSAESEATAARDLLVEAGVSATIFDSSFPGVPSGVFEVRVPASEAARAEELMAAHSEVVEQAVDPSHDLDLKPVFSAMGTTAEMEAIGIRSILEASGLPVVLVGSSQLPNLRFEVRVPRDRVEEARRLIAEARAAGPEAAEEAESASEE